jgi:hypothetical protein
MSARSDNDLLDRIDDLAFEIAAGNLKVDSDLDTILSLSITPAGKALLRPILPAALS